MKSELLRKGLTSETAEQIERGYWEDFFDKILEKSDYGDFYYHPGVYEDLEKAGISSVIESLTHVPAGLYNGSNITSIELPQNITKLDRFAFLNCEKLKTVKLPNTVKSIGTLAFQNCYELTSINIPRSCVVDDKVFQGCNKLRTVAVDKFAKLHFECFYNCPIETVIFNGTMKQSERVFKPRDVRRIEPYTSSGNVFHIQCTDGVLDYLD